jgi:hypothetical protein
MPRFDLEKLTIGREVHDMHDGFPDLPALFGDKATLAYSVRLGVKGGCAAITAILTAQAKAENTSFPMYTNKHLVFIGIDFEDHDYGTVFQFAYSYDDTRIGIIGIALAE